MTTDRRADIPDTSGFWLGLATVAATLGGGCVVIAITVYQPPWPSGWFIAGVVISGLGFAFSIWALVLYVARRIAGDHWCPDPQAHLAKAEDERNIRQSISAAVALRRPSAKAISAVTDASNRIDLIKWLRPVLQEINGDLEQAEKGIQRAQNEDSYVNVRHEFNVGEVWNKNHARLAGVTGREDLYGSLRNAYDCINRIRIIVAPENPLVRQPVKPRPQHDLAGALEAIRSAKTTVKRELADLA